MKPIVYLAGPILGQTYEGATNWREEAIQALPECDVRSPMRGKEFLRTLPTMPKTDEGIASQHSIVLRDHWDVRTATALLVNLRGADRISVGTCFELAWAIAYRIPAIVIMDEERMHDHPFVREAAYIVVDTMEEALIYVRQVLNLIPATEVNA